ncbi:unnamed protein product [Auanema sp. JU1783]|nr:unnamed protein product [Auanema sp. JU1783]
MLQTLLFTSFVFVLGTCESTELVRSKRQSYYYICGIYPNQFYSASPCAQNDASRGECLNGGTKIGVGCYYDYQCTPYANGRSVECSNYCCCTKPRTATQAPNLSSFAYCVNGQRSNVRCSSNFGCSSGQTCLNGLCCTTTGSEWQGACGGVGALSVCSNNACRNSFCSTSNYCCECQYGRTSGLCTNGCPSGYSCSSNNYCCPFCPNGQAPYGTCYNGLCAAGYTCRPGNICCNF